MHPRAIWASLVFVSTAELFLAKLLPFLVYPLSVTVLLVIMAGLCVALRLWRYAAATLVAALLLLWTCSTPRFAAWALGTLERQYPARAISEIPEADVAIVLGGAIEQPFPPRVVAELSSASNRILYAARLYRAGKVKRVLVSGGNLPWQKGIKPEAEFIRELLMEWGVPSSAIEVGTGSRNTFENALEVKEIWSRSRFNSALLVTSAAHMPRAMAVFRGAGLPVIASTTDVRIVELSSAILLDWLPSAGGLATTTEAMKEWIGYWAYRTRGYL
jgi:uncharacterized SAM-binding protein YcdF (DUF218 family)